MKRYVVMMAVAMAAICTSCSKDDDVTQVEPPTTPANSEVTIKFSTDDITTRAFFDNRTESEAWEKSISKATLILERYEDPTQYPIERIHRVLTADQIAAGSTTVGLVGTNADDLIVVAVGANLDIPEGTAAMAIESSIINTMDIADYNGSFEQVSTGSMRSEGFVLYGVEILNVTESNKAISTALQLERQVVKIAIQASISDNFNNPSYFAGDLRVDEITVRSTKYLTDYDFEEGFTSTQASYKNSDYFQNLFYIGESRRNDFTVLATYDADGDFSTTTDQKAVTYVFSITDNVGNCKEMLDNQYYRITVNINSMETTDMDVSFSVADWVSVTDQTVDL